MITLYWTGNAGAPTLSATFRVSSRARNDKTFFKLDDTIESAAPMNTQNGSPYCLRVCLLLGSRRRGSPTTTFDAFALRSTCPRPPGIWCLTSLHDGQWCNLRVSQRHFFTSDHTGAKDDDQQQDGVKNASEGCPPSIDRASECPV